MRSRFEASAPPPPADIRSITVDAARVPAEWVIAPGATSRQRFLYLHGGVYIMGSFSRTAQTH
jgi:acetyl esterase/lipase